MQKSELRRELASARKAWTKDYLAASDAEISARVLALPEWQQAACVFIYVSVRTEPDTRALIDAALKAGKRVAVPLCGAPGQMDAREIISLDELLPRAYGLLEPSETAPVVAPEEFDLAVIPCVAADERGYRLGHGGGYYDRYIPQMSCPRVCLCRDRELLPEVPVEPTDAPMDMIITENRIIAR